MNRQHKIRLTIIRHSIRNWGADRLLLDYALYLVKRGHAVTYWTNKINTRFSIDPGIELKKIPLPGVLGTMIFTLVTRFKTDILLVDLVVMSVLAWFLNKRTVVYLAQDDDRTYYSGVFLRKLTDWLYKLSLSVMKMRVMSVSEYLASQLNRYSGGQIVVVSNGIDPKKFFPEKESRFLTEKGTRKVIALYARGDYRKGLDIGIKAIEELARLRGTKDWELWAIGAHPVKIDSEKIRLKCLGLLPDDDLRVVLSAADIYLSCSRHEGFGLMQLEAMACGCVMVTTKAFSLVKNEVNGLVCDVEDWHSLAQNLNRVLDDPILIERLKKNGFKLASDFSLEKSCVQFEKALRGFCYENNP